MEVEKYLKISKKFSCELCDVCSSRKQDYETHILTAKHQRKCMEIEKYLNFPKNGFHCNECNFTTLKKSIFDKHQTTIKHIRNTNKETDKLVKHICDVCNKEYLNSSGLWKHKKICQVLENKTELTNEFREPDTKRPEITVELFMDLIKQNKELQDILIEQNKQHNYCKEIVVNKSV